MTLPWTKHSKPAEPMPEKRWNNATTEKMG